MVHGGGLEPENQIVFIPQKVDPIFLISKFLTRRRLAFAVMLLLLGSIAFLSACAQLKSNSNPEVWGYKVIEAYPHDVGAFTQGLIMFDGQMYEGTGGNGGSTLRRVDFKTGQVQADVKLHQQYFGEGITMMGDRIFQLTWKNQIGLIYEAASLKFLEKFSYSGEGWGLTNDGKFLIMSDGTSTLRFLDPSNFKVVKRLTVKLGKQKISSLNELEYVNGEIWANVWYDERIVRISPSDGSVLGWINLTGLFPRGPQDRERVLNGIAYDSKEGRLFVTGKNWPQLFEIEVVRP
jgi:glutamine cyclotransferase